MTVTGDDRVDLMVMADEDLLVPLVCQECDDCRPGPVCLEVLSAPAG